MAKSYSFSQTRGFTSAQWQLIRRFTHRKAREAGGGLHVTENQQQTSLTIEGPAMQRGEPFVISQAIDLENEADVECKTRSMPYGDVVHAVLEFAGKNFPDQFAWGYEPDGEEVRLTNYQHALDLARSQWSECPDYDTALMASEILEHLGAFALDREDCVAAVEQARHEVVDASYSQAMFGGCALHLLMERREDRGDGNGYVADEKQPVITVSVNNVAEIHEEVENRLKLLQANGSQYPQIVSGNLYGPHSPEPIATVRSDEGIRVLPGEWMMAAKAQVDEDAPGTVQAVDLLKACQQCKLFALMAYHGDSATSLNRLVETLCRQFGVEDEIARPATEAAYLQSVNHEVLLRMLERARGQASTDREGGRLSGGTNGAHSYVEAKMPPESQIGLLVARLSGEWEVALAQAQRVLGDDAAYFQLAASESRAFQLSEDPTEEPLWMDCQREEKQRRAAMSVLGVYTDWRENLLYFTENLAERSTIQPNLNHGVFEQLDTYFRGNGRQRAGECEPTVIAAVARMAKLSEALEVFRPGSHRATCRDYLKILEVVDTLGIERTKGTREVLDMQGVAWGIRADTPPPGTVDMAFHEGRVPLDEASAETAAGVAEPLRGRRHR